MEDHIEGISARTTIGADRRINLDGDASAGGHPLSFNVKAEMSDPSQPRQTTPVEFSLDAPGLLQAPLSSKADVRLSWLAGARRIGVTAGASAPEELVEEVVGCLGGLVPVSLDERSARQERVVFPLPQEVR